MEQMQDEKSDSKDKADLGKDGATGAADAPAKAPAKVQGKAASPQKPGAPVAQAAKPAGKTMKVKSFVNMTCKDDSTLVEGKICDISVAEYERLLKDERGPFFEVFKG